MIIQHLKRRDAHSIIYSTCINSQNVILNYYNKLGADSDYRKVRWKGEKSGKRCEKSGKYWIKSRNRKFEEVQFFPVSAPANIFILQWWLFILLYSTWNACFMRAANNISNWVALSCFSCSWCWKRWASKEMLKFFFFSYQLPRNSFFDFDLKLFSIILTEKNCNLFILILFSLQHMVCLLYVHQH